MESVLDTEPRRSSRTYEPAKQWLRFSPDNSQCIDNEWTEVAIIMEEDTARTSYMTIAVGPDTSVIAPGDSVLVNPGVKFDNGTVVPFPEWQEFSVAITEGGRYGTLLAPSHFETESDTADYLDEAEGIWAFIAAEGIDRDSAIVTMQAHIIFTMGSRGRPADIAGQPPKVSAQRTSSQFAFDDSEWPFPPFGPFFSTLVSGTEQVTVKKPITCAQPEKIMLGGTKYFYARIDESNPQKLLGG